MAGFVNDRWCMQNDGAAQSRLVRQPEAGDPRNDRTSLLHCGLSIDTVVHVEGLPCCAAERVQTNWLQRYRPSSALRSSSEAGKIVVLTNTGFTAAQIAKVSALLVACSALSIYARLVPTGAQGP